MCCQPGEMQIALENEGDISTRVLISAVLKTQKPNSGLRLQL